MGVPVTTMVHCWVSVFPFASTTLDVKVKVPAVVGLPEITPALLSVSPGGNVPETSEYLNGEIPPVTVSAEEYATPTVALPLPQAPQSRLIVEPVIVMLHVAVSVLPFLSVTLAVKL